MGIYVHRFLIASQLDAIFGLLSLLNMRILCRQASPFTTKEGEALPTSTKAYLLAHT